MADGYTTMYEILSNPLSERREVYGTKDIQHITIDGNRFGGYKTFTSYWEKTYIKEPERSASGVIENLNSYATFTTFHLKVNFAMMSIDDYRRLYDLMLSKNEFTVTAYNVIDNSRHTCKMYFAPDQMPKLYAVARKLQGDRFVEVLGVQDYTIELIGTNNDMNRFTVIYYDGGNNAIERQEAYMFEEFLLGHNVVVPDYNGKKFSGWWKKKGTGTLYAHNSEITAWVADASTVSLGFTAQYE
jgi:hypothetical protein